MSASSVSLTQPYVGFLNSKMLQQEKEKFDSVLPISKNARTVFDLSPEEILQTEERMRPEGWSGEGFLKSGDRLLSVCIADGNTLLENKVPCHLIADMMSSILEEASKSPDPKPIIAGKFKVTKQLPTDGYQECPFARSKETTCHTGRADPVIINIMNGIAILANDLTIEMIRHHFFFQTGPFSLRPQDAIDCLELKTTHYEVITENFAQRVDSENLNQNEDEIRKYEKEKKLAEKLSPSLPIAEGITGYILPYKDRDSYENHGLTVEQKIRKQGVLKGLTEAKIQLKLDSHARWGKYCSPPKTREEMLFEVIKRQEKDGDQFLHVFNDQKREDNQMIQEVAGYQLSDPIKWAGTYIFELTTKTRMNLPSENSGKKRKREPSIT